MANRQKTSVSEMKVGILVTVALLLLAAIILQQSWGINWFGRTAQAITYLPDVGGLKPGAPVWLAGIEIGKVSKVSLVSPTVFAGNRETLKQIAEVQKQLESLNPKEASYSKFESALKDRLSDLKTQLSFVEVRMDIREQFLDRISRDSTVSIDSKGLIGDSFLDISPGSYGTPPRKIGNDYLIEGVRAMGFREIMTGANDVVANFGTLSDQFKNIALKIDPDKVGETLKSALDNLDGTMKEAQTTFEHATSLVDDLHGGNGTVAKLITDPAAYENLVSALERFNKLADEIQHGPGTMSKLIQNPEPFDRLNKSLEKVNSMMERIEKGEGTLGRLSKDPALYDRINVALEKFASLADQLDKGEGTIGKLLKDPSLYNNLNQSTAEITKFIYDLRQDPKKYLTIRFRLF